jgi:predicted HicB family RNase H-like nuclease
VKDKKELRRKTLNLRISEEEHGKLKRLAKRERRSMISMVVWLVEKFERENPR